MRPIERVYAFDSDETVACRFAADLSCELRIEVEPIRDLGAGVKRSDICVTCTPSRRPLLEPEDVVPGTFIAAVGADSPERQELDPRLMASNTVVADLLPQCETIGELHQAIEEDLIVRTDLHAELGEVIAGRRPGRTSGDEIIIFDVRRPSMRTEGSKFPRLPFYSWRSWDPGGYESPHRAGFVFGEIASRQNVAQCP